jgi:uncharacterized OB-fold protein
MSERGDTRVRTRPTSLTGRRCGCGGLTEPDRPACAKCYARQRWVRRKARHDGIGEDL